MLPHEQLKGQLVKSLVDFFEQDYRRITHAIEVLKHAEAVAENHPDADMEIVIASAILHDVGIKPSEADLGYNNGKTQEQYGPAVATKLLSDISFAGDKATKVTEIIGNHHSPSRYDYVELEILKTADRIVNQIDAAQ